MNVVRSVFIAIGFLLAMAPSFAETIEIVTLPYPPYEYAEENKAEGIAVRIVQQVFDHLSISTNITILPWKRALYLARTGKADAIFTAYKTPEREKFLDYSKVTLMPQTVSVWRRKGSNIEYDGSLKSLSSHIIGIVLEISYGSTVDNAIKSKQLTMLDYAPTSELNIKKLLLGRYNLVIMNRYGARYHLALLGRTDQVEELDPPLQQVPSFIAFSKLRNHRALRDRFDVELERMITDGSYKKIIDDYFKSLQN